MTRPYLERRNHQVFVLVERRKVPPKDVPAVLKKMGFGIVTYALVRQIICQMRKFHKNSQIFTPPKI